MAFGCKNDTEVIEQNDTIDTQKSADSKNVKIDVIVDVEKLLEEYPNGGEVTTEGIITMIQKGGYYEYENGNLSKLITKAEIGTKIKWKIKSGTTSDNLDLAEYVPEDDQMLNVFKVKPGKVGDDEIDGVTIDEQPTENFRTQYTLSFYIKKNPDIVWTWDPMVIYPQPPV